MIFYKKNETKNFYDTVYGHYTPAEFHCLYSNDDLNKARKKVSQVFNAFGRNPLPMGAYILDVGCGLGYVSEAFCLAGAFLSGIEIAQTAIDLTRRSFPNIDFKCLSFSAEIEYG